MNENYLVPWRRVLRKPATNGFKLPIIVAEGNRRPHEPVQAAKFASEAGVILRSQVPIFANWKQYKKQTEHFDNFMGKLAVSIYLHSFCYIQL